MLLMSDNFNCGGFVFNYLVKRLVISCVIKIIGNTLLRHIGDLCSSQHFTAITNHGPLSGFFLFLDVQLQGYARYVYCYLAWPKMLHVTIDKNVMTLFQLRIGRCSKAC